MKFSITAFLISVLATSVIADPYQECCNNCYTACGKRNNCGNAQGYCSNLLVPKPDRNVTWNLFWIGRKIFQVPNDGSWLKTRAHEPLLRHC
ncbi:hypothetical protein E2P81_ATG05989 [Venturia nashicola]|nr:hypothetical protein E2P81_ATG05989 [Venturia nashicola]